MARTPVLRAGCGLERQWLHAVGLGFEHPGTGEWVTFTSDYSPIWSGRSNLL